MVDLVHQYGLVLVFGIVFIEQMGLPIPAVPVLIVAGAATAAGTISPLAVCAVAFTACAIADASWYGAGRLYGRRVMKLLCQISLSPDSCVRQSEGRFRRWGRLTLVLAKFVPGLSTIMPPLAGTVGLNWRAFALLDGLGAAIWVGLAVGSGMLFHHEVDRLIADLQELGILAIKIVGVLLAGFIAIKWWQRRHFHNMLRMARITVDELQRLMKEEPPPVVVDLRTSSIRKQDNRFIPGAWVMDFEEVDQWLDRMPTDRELVFYCTCPNEAGAALVAKKLIEVGFTRVRPLLGGLDAWIAAGYQVLDRAVAVSEDASIHVLRQPGGSNPSVSSVSY